MNLRRLIIAGTLVCLSAISADAQRIKDEFKQASDSLRVLMKERTTVKSTLSIDRVLRRGDNLDFYFTQELSDFSWRKEDAAWFKKTLKDLFPAKYANCRVGEIRYKNHTLESMVTPGLGNDGRPKEYDQSCTAPVNPPFIRRVGEQTFHSGLSGRHIALWQSHGRYFEAKTGRWEWQRATVQRTVEDMYTQSYVIPFLIPMLQNAGAYTMSPRETDTQRNEVVCDNDKAFTGTRGQGVRLQGSYRETGVWKSAGVGFADMKEVYTRLDNPFEMGTVRMADCISSRENWNRAEARWTADIPERGNYAVYVAYKSMPNSSEDAHYTVHHMGGTTEFLVNQKIGGGTWICLGNFEFAPGSDAFVTLDNILPEGRSAVVGSVVTADAVRFGGGMGKVARGVETDPVEDWELSEMPAFVEGAVYNMQWSGVDTTVVNRWEYNDYTTDYASRGAWTEYMKNKGIPFDLSFAFHTDAGMTPDDEIVGTLAIYTLMADGSSKLPDGRDRITARHLTDLVQQQIVDDIRADFEPSWTRRQLWDRNYSESRTTTVPAMLLELLSHQNFADMKYGLDPSFRFAVSRAIYKGMLKYLSDLYRTPYIVQPLPVNSMSVLLDGSKARISWKNTDDPKEPTADAKGYILYTRIDDGAFDQGRILENVRRDGDRFSTEVAMDAGHIYSFRIVAFNDGGKSFPSETLCAGIASKNAKKVLVVNNFTRVGAPSWFDTPEYAGFDGNIDKGVAYGYEINYIGENYENRRKMEWTDDDNPGFGSSHSTHAGLLIPGNTFDFAIMHGRSIMNAGYSFDSASSAAFASNPAVADGSFAADIICGKQISTALGRDAVPARHEVFPDALQNAIRNYTAKGGSIIISGAYIGTDSWDEIYPIQKDAVHVENTRKFIQDVLGYNWLTNHACYTGSFERVRNSRCQITTRTPIQFWQDINAGIYSVESPDGIIPAGKNASTILRYTGNGISAAVCAEMKKYKVISYGFPLETVKDESMRDELIKTALKTLAD